ncbi:MAG: GbsR/MarR family transcriptional regulator [Thermodesulfovibrionales bacterium]
MSNPAAEIREGLMEAMGRITSFWGFSKIMGQLYGLLYLSPNPLTLDEMSESLSISKGNVSINIRALERWNMVRTVWVKGDRKDYYEAETDFWKIVKGVLREREKKEFDLALDSVSKLLNRSVETQKTAKSAETAFAIERLKKLEDFIQTMDKLVGVLMTLEDLKRNFFGITKKK